MGFFDSLFGGKRRTNVEVVPDRIWMTTDAKYAGLLREAEERSSSATVAILLVAHFPDVFGQLEVLVESRSWRAPCKAAMASDLDASLAASLHLDDSSTLDLIVAERHPLPSVDDRLEAFAEELPCRCRFSHHVSLEDPVMEIFAGDWVKNVLKQMGMKDDEAIESQMVSRRIRQAQRKIEGKAFGSLEAQSADEWLANNCPELARRE